MKRLTGSSLPRSFSLALVALCTLAFAAGCASTNEPRDLMSEEANAGGAAERPVAMRGETAFLDGKIGAVVTISRGFERERSENARAGSRGHEITARDMRRNGDEDDIYDIYSDREEDQKRAYEAYMRQVRAHRAAGSPMPPVTLRVEIQNRGAEAVDVEVTEVNSYLGNFAVRPSKLTIAPGESAVLDPMISQLGVTSDEIPLKLAVRVADRKEAQVVPVKNIIAASVRN